MAAVPQFLPSSLPVLWFEPRQINTHRAVVKGYEQSISYYAHKTISYERGWAHLMQHFASSIYTTSIQWDESARVWEQGWVCICTCIWLKTVDDGIQHASHLTSFMCIIIILKLCLEAYMHVYTAILFLHFHPYFLQHFVYSLYKYTCTLIRSSWLRGNCSETSITTSSWRVFFTWGKIMCI